MTLENGHDAEIRQACNLLGNLSSLPSSRLGPHFPEARFGPKPTGAVAHRRLLADLVVALCPVSKFVGSGPF
jgi:hypothetical protein